jgi:hypothetical protein
MAAPEQTTAGYKRRGRPRVRKSPSGLVRRNLLVDPVALEELRALYGSKSESEAVRRVIDLALLAAEAQAISEKVSRRTDPPVVYTPPPPLPVYLQPGDVPDDLLE